MEKQLFGKKLLEIRRAKGLTQEEVAEKCGITTRTIQRIESGLVEPRAYTIKTISETIGFEFFESSNTGDEVNSEKQSLNTGKHTILWYVKDLFNFKTKAMRKISILTASIILITLLCVNFLNAEDQTERLKTKKSLSIQMNDNKSIKRVEVAFTHSLTLDSLIKIKNDLQKIGIVIHYKKIEFDLFNLLVNLDCEVICNDGFSGSFGTGVLNSQNPRKRIGFYRDYSPNAESPFGTGFLD
ncbi:MAG: helix-turn-helix domain-containing protein [Bacteroidales bacterium]|nr:helix-turn-helix domain-containing protein [Bacteroidales bacterium]